MQKKKILIHSLVFSPDGVSTAYLYNDIALGFKENGYDVVVLTTTPHYNLVQDELKKQPLSRYCGGLFHKSSFNGIPVYHVPQKKFISFSARVAGFIYWHFLSLILGLAQKNISLILSPSPPLTIGFLSIIIAKIKKAKVIYNVQEIYPDFLINQGNLKSGFLLNLLKRLERFVYNQSDLVTTIDEVFHETIVGRFKNPEKLAVIPNFVDTDVYKPIEKDDLTLDKNYFPDKAVLKLMYAGNIGHAQDWQPLLYLAHVFSKQPVEFWVIGEGVVKESLRSEIDRLRLQNIHLLPYQPRQYMSAVIGYADLHFIFMDPQMEGQGFPSKVYTIMACKKPLLVLSGTGTPLANFLKDKSCSFLVTESDNTNKYKKLELIIKDLLKNTNELTKLGEQGFEIIQKQYSKKSVVQQYVDIVDNLLSRS